MIGTIYLAVSRLLNGAIALVVVFLLSNYFSAEEYGLFGLIYSTLTVISTFCYAWLGAYFLRFTKMSSHARSIFQLTLLSFAAMLVCLWVIYLSRATWGIFEIAIIGIGAVAVGFFFVTQEFLAGRQLYKSYLLVSVVRFCLALILVGLIMYAGPDPNAIIFMLAAAMIVPSLYVFFLYGYRWFSSLKITDFLTVDRSQMANIARYSLPFVATSLSAALMGLADRIVIEHFLGLRAVGLYIGTHDLTFQIIGAATSVLVSRILPPSAAAFEAQGLSTEFSRIFLRRVLIMLLAMIGLVVICLLSAPHTYLRILAPEAQKIALSFYVLTILGTGILSLNTLVFLTVLMLQKRTQIIFLVSIVSLVTNVICNIFLVPTLGLAGAALAFVLACTAGLIVSSWSTAEFWKTLFCENRITLARLKRGGR
jgi:O-antigen/teichoic acid export membrane protein